MGDNSCCQCSEYPALPKKAIKMSLNKRDDGKQRHSARLWSSSLSQARWVQAAKIGVYYRSPHLITGIDHNEIIVQIFLCLHSCLMAAAINLEHKSIFAICELSLSAVNRRHSTSSPRTFPIGHILCSSFLCRSLLCRKLFGRCPLLICRRRRSRKRLW
jgi:hypothetical protein